MLTAISFAVFSSNLATNSDVPAYLPIIAASVTAKIGGVSIIIKSYFPETVFKTYYNLSLINNSAGFGGAIPLGIKSKPLFSI